MLLITKKDNFTKNDICDFLLQKNLLFKYIIFTFIYELETY